MINSYPEKPEIAYHRTHIDMPDVVLNMRALDAPKEVKRSAYVIFRFESANGQSGINNNYAGLQADSHRWPEEYDRLIAGTCVKEENGTGKERRFLCFKSFADFMEMYMDRLEKRGLYVGGYAHLIAKMVITNPTELAIAYERDWVKGSKGAVPSTQKVKNFLSMYATAEKIFTK